MSSVTAPPDVLRWTSRSGDHGDCVVAAMELACGVTYEEALQAASKAQPRVLRLGLNWPQTRKALGYLGFQSRVRRAGSFELDESTGILHVYQPGKHGMGRRGHASSHAVYLWDGRIVEPKFDRRQLWKDAEQFLKHYGYRAGSLLVLERKGESHEAMV